MNTLKNNFLNKLKSKTTHLLLVTVVLDIIALAFYFKFGTSIFIPKLSTAVIIFMILGIVLPFAVAFSPLKIPYVALYVINLMSCFYYLSSQASFIANVFVGIDGTSFPAAFYVIIATTLVSAVLSLVAMRFVKEKCFNEKGADKTDTTIEEKAGGKQA